MIEKELEGGELGQGIRMRPKEFHESPVLTHEEVEGDASESGAVMEHQFQAVE